MLDFDTVAAILAFILNSAGLATLVNLLGGPEIVKISGDLAGEVGKANADPGYIRRETKKFSGMIFSPWILILHIVNLGIYILLGILLAVGPQNLLAQLQAGTAAEALTPLEFLLYLLWLVISVLVYFVTAMVPSYRHVRLYIQAKRWLRLKAHEH